MATTAIKLLKTSPKKLKGNRPRGSSLRDLDKRYGRRIRLPFHLKKDQRLRRAASSARKDAPSPASASTSRNRIILWTSVIAIAVILGGVFHAIHLSTIHTWSAAINGWLLFLFILVLPLVGVPMSICGIMIGAKFGAMNGMAVTAVAVAFHLSASWVIARTWLRKPMEIVLKKTRYKLPSLETGEYAGVCLLTALIPGPSYTLKNYFMALSKLPLGVIIGIGLPANLFAMSPGILFGSLAGTMSWPKAIFLIGYALLLLVAAHWVIRIIRARSRHSPGPIHR